MKEIGTYGTGNSLQEKSLILYPTSIKNNANLHYNHHIMCNKIKRPLTMACLNISLFKSFVGKSKFPTGISYIKKNMIRMDKDERKENT